MPVLTVTVTCAWCGAQREVTIPDDGLRVVAIDGLCPDCAGGNGLDCPPDHTLSCPASGTWKETVTPYWSSPVATLYQGDSATVLAQLQAESVDMAVTSPPFWGQRDYHVDGQLGREATPDAYIARMVEVFREVRRVLRPWGTAWVEIGDGYASGKGTCFNPGGGEHSLAIHSNLKEDCAYPLDRGNKSTLVSSGLKPLDLVGIPFRLALALQADGWWLRSVIIWHHPSCMPESIAGWRWEKCRVSVGNHQAKQDTYIGCDALPGGRHGSTTPDWADCPGCPKCAPNGGLVLRRGSWRPTEAHSYVLMLAKSANYFANGEAVRERTDSELSPEDYAAACATAGQKDWYPRANSDGGAYRWHNIAPPGGRNLRTIWRIASEPTGFAHYASYPTELPRRCILAGTSEWGNCPQCGMPWAPVVSHANYGDTREGRRGADADEGKHGWRKAEEVGWEAPVVTSWRPTCQCGLSERVPPVVLDPFTGTSSTGVAAQELGRRFIGIDISEKYLAMSRQRLERVNLPLGASCESA